MLDMLKDKCPVCKSENIKITDCYYEDDDGTQVKHGNLWDAKCNDCGWEYLLYGD